MSKLHLVLVDGSGFIFRAFHALPPMTRSDGTPVNAVFGFTNMLSRLLADHTGTHLAVIFDAGRTTFRNEVYADYKAHRPPPPDELIPQFALIRECTEAFGVPAIELPGFEADDLIACYAHAAVAAGGEATIVSSDKDLMQLIAPGIGMLDPLKQKAIGPAEVFEKFGVTPDRVVEVQALMGDSVDNVPGVRGIGPKTAGQLIQEYGTVEAVLEAAANGSMKASKRRDLLVEYAEQARISRQLVELKCDIALPQPIEALIVREADRAKLVGFLGQQGFRSTIQRLGLNDVQAARPPVLVQTEGNYGPYATVTSLDELNGWIADARTNGAVAIDTETNSLHPIAAELLGISLAIAPGRACYIPLRHETETPQLPVEQVLEALRPLFAEPGVLKIFPNAKYALRAFESAGIALIAPIDDTMVISYAQSAGSHGHTLDELSQLHLNHKPISADEVTGTGRNRLAFDKAPVERAAGYSSEKSDITLRLWQKLRPSLRTAKSQVLYEQVERPLITVLTAMERAGIKVDAGELRAASADFAVRMAEKEAKAFELVGHPFNLGSPKQLGEILFEEMSLPGGKRTASGAWGTDASVLSDLAEQGHELPATIVAWRQLSKLKSTYTDSLPLEVDASSGRIHTSFSQAIAATGRLSSTDPNLQNIPVRTDEGTRIRRAFIAEPGHVLISADYSQIELRLLAHVANIPALRDSFANGEDIHARTASEVFGIPMAQMDKETRRRAKAINFGIIYGISAFGLARQLGIAAGEAKYFIDRYFARYPQIRAYMEEAKSHAREHGFVVTPFGRRVYVPQIKDKNGAARAYAERAAINAPLQGGAADIIKRAMIKLPDALREAGLGARMILQVHDELVFEVPHAAADSTAVLAQTIMSGAASLSVPLVVETGIGANWAEAH